MNRGWVYSISSSACASSDGGIVNPSAFTVFRLMTSSNLVGACTGKSRGLVTYSPQRGDQAMSAKRTIACSARIAALIENLPFIQ